MGLLAFFGGLSDRGATQNGIRPQHLFDKYTLGKEVGRGAFGIVFSARCKESGQEFAVKRVCRKSSPMASIDAEVGMLRRLAHPTVAELQDVYSCARTVDMVFSIYRGGDLASAMLLHWDAEGDIPMAAVQNLVWQMLRAVEWLHRNGVVHRDVKPENYLLDRADLGRAQCRVFLSDFGTAAELRPDKRLAQRCGTYSYWPPEVYAQDYGLKVDAWAVGVSMFCLLTGAFPFADEDEVRTTTVRAPSRCEEPGRSFLRGVLARGEDVRLSAGEALRHPFLEPLESAAARSEDACSKPEVGGEGSGRVEAPLPPPAPRAKTVITTASSRGAGERQQDGSTAREIVDLPCRTPSRAERASGLGGVICFFVVISLLFLALHVDSLSQLCADNGCPPYGVAGAAMQIGALVPTLRPILHMQGCRV